MSIIEKFPTTEQNVIIAKELAEKFGSHFYGKETYDVGYGYTVTVESQDDDVDITDHMGMKAEWSQDVWGGQRPKDFDGSAFVVRSGRNGKLWVQLDPSMDTSEMRERVKSYFCDGWSYKCMKLTVIVEHPDNAKYTRTETSYVGGIESDGGAEYLEELILDQLTDMMKDAYSFRSLTTIIEERLALEAEAVEIWTQVWKPKFRATNTEAEFRSVEHDLFMAAGGTLDPIGIVWVHTVCERDALRQRMA